MNIFYSSRCFCRALYLYFSRSRQQQQRNESDDWYIKRFSKNNSEQEKEENEENEKEENEEKEKRANGSKFRCNFFGLQSLQWHCWSQKTLKMLCTKKISSMYIVSMSLLIQA